MKRMLFILLILAGCVPATANRHPRAGSDFTSPSWQCEMEVCPRAAFDNRTRSWGSVYDGFDETCICIFSDNVFFTTPRK